MNHFGSTLNANLHPDGFVIDRVLIREMSEKSPTDPSDLRYHRTGAVANLMVAVLSTVSPAVFQEAESAWK